MSCIPIPGLHRQILHLLRPRHITHLEQPTGQDPTHPVSELRAALRVPSPHGQTRSLRRLPEVMTSANVAKLLGHPVEQIQIWCRAGMLPATGTMVPMPGDSTRTN